MLIIPAINTSDTSEAVRLIDNLNNVILPHGYDLARVQIDINDGTFEDVVTITPETLSELDIKFKVDYHLMVKDPASWVRRCVKADRIIGQIEYMPDQLSFIKEVKDWRLKAGFAIDFGTDLNQINYEALGQLDVVLLMTYPAGRGGKEFNSGVYDKIEELIDIKTREKFTFNICLDGGISEDNIKSVKIAGVDEVAMTKRILEGDIEDNLEKFYKLMY